MICGRMYRPAACAALALASFVPARGEATFDNAVFYGAGTIPEGVAIGDLDGDLDNDLAVVNRGGHLQVLRNNGNGTFQSAVSFNNLWPSSSYTVDVRMADLDRDGDNDLAVAFTSVYGSVSVLLNDGGGTFAPPVNYDACNSTQGITIGDFDGDLHRDIAGMNNCFKASILLNDGNAGLVKKGDYGFGYVPGGIDSADLDGDRDEDIVYSNGTNNLTVLLNDGTGAFPVATGIGASDQPQWLALADIDGDTDNDIVVVNLYTNDIAIFRNDGSASFAGPTRYAVGAAPRSLAGGDLDNDGDIDFASANSGSDSVTFRWNAGDGTFPTQSSKSAGDGSSEVAVGDLNGDARLDVIVANENGNNVAVFINRLNAAPDTDNDGVANASDCAPSNAAAWAMPSAVTDVLLSGPGTTRISWSAPARTGSSAIRYDLLRSTSPASFQAAECVQSNGTAGVAFDATVPAALLAYLVRTENACGGNLGTSSGGDPRIGASCP